MSGLALEFALDGRRALDRASFRTVLHALEHRGPDGRREYSFGRGAIGHQHFWVTPEEVGEEQPLVDEVAGIAVAFDGRLDNRHELIAALQLSAREGSICSDADLLLHAYKAWGERCFERLLGPFAALIVDERRQRVLGGRDALGLRGLAYFLDRQTLVVASEEQAVLQHPRVSSRFDEEALARFLSVRSLSEDATFFADVSTLPAGCFFVLDEGGFRLDRHWQFDRSRRIRYRHDEEYVEHFRELVRDSVACCLRTVQPPVVLMSGGLDSTSVAATAAGMLSPGRRLKTISWVFDELRGADERAWISPMVERFDFEQIQIPCDDEWPLKDVDTWPWCPSSPIQDLFRRPRQRAYESARQAGATVVLDGTYGDNLYFGHTYWLRDLLAQGRLWEACRGVMGHFRAPAGGRWGRLRRPLARALGYPGRDPGSPIPLTAFARRKLDAGGHPASRRGRRPDLEDVVLDPNGALGVALETFYANQAGVELWRPFRDRRLVEFVLSAPAHILYRPGWPKWGLRRAMAGVRPDEFRLRRERTSLSPLAVRGLAERERGTVGSLLFSEDSLWPAYIEPKWLGAHFAEGEILEDKPLPTVALWCCVMLELWHNRLARMEQIQSLPTGTEPVANEGVVNETRSGIQPALVA